jgi:hypothetical protein
MDVKLEWSHDEIELIKSLASNYAVAGEVLAQFFVDNVHLLRELVPDCVRRMYTEYKAPNDERYWMAGVGCIVAAVHHLERQVHRHLQHPVREIIESYRRQIENLRAVYQGRQAHRRGRAQLLHSGVSGQVRHRQVRRQGWSCCDVQRRHKLLAARTTRSRGHGPGGAWRVTGYVWTSILRNGCCVPSART